MCLNTCIHIRISEYYIGINCQWRPSLYKCFIYVCVYIQIPINILVYTYIFCSVALIFVFFFNFLCVYIHVFSRTLGRFNVCENAFDPIYRCISKLVCVCILFARARVCVCMCVFNVGLYLWNFFSFILSNE